MKTLEKGGEWSASRFDRFTSRGRAPGTSRIGWVGPKPGLDALEKTKILPLPGIELRPFNV
jgi:hypothetical protein